MLSIFSVLTVLMLFTVCPDDLWSQSAHLYHQTRPTDHRGVESLEIGCAVRGRLWYIVKCKYWLPRAIKRFPNIEFIAIWNGLVHTYDCDVGQDNSNLFVWCLAVYMLRGRVVV